jgi:hypothetical protein
MQPVDFSLCDWLHCDFLRSVEENFMNLSAKSRVGCLLWLGLSVGFLASLEASTFVNGVEFLNLTGTAITATDTNPDTVIVPDQVTHDIGGVPTTFAGGQINGAIFRQGLASDPVKSSGSGTFRDLYNLQNNGAESGYNRNGVGDASVPGGFNPFITVGSLVADSSGSYYIFALDINEQNNANGRWLVLDDLRLYVGSATDPVTLPEPTPPGTMVWGMNEGGSRQVLLDYGYGSGGSGSMDLWVFVPVSEFAGYSSNQYVYLYSSFGSLAVTDAVGSRDWGAGAGSEQWSLPSTPVPVQTIAVPEPSALAFAAGALVVGAFGRRKRRAGVPA